MRGWEEYQEEAARFFREIGFSAETNAKVSGVRSSSDVDVLASISVSGFQVVWVIECKHWSEPVSKSHVFALRQIVTDLGADRGILLCERGFQSGAIEASSFTNIQLTSLADLKVSSRNTVSNFIIQQMFDRSIVCKERYWEIPKYIRICTKLRPGSLEFSNYSGDKVCDFLIKYTSISMRNIYPMHITYFDTLMLGSHSLLHFGDQCPPKSMDAILTIRSSSEAVAFLEPILLDLELKLEHAEDLWRANYECI